MFSKTSRKCGHKTLPHSWIFGQVDILIIKLNKSFDFKYDLRTKDSQWNWEWKKTGDFVKEATIWPKRRTVYRICYKRDNYNLLVNFQVLYRNIHFTLCYEDYFHHLIYLRVYGVFYKCVKSFNSHTKTSVRQFQDRRQLSLFKFHET